jgi:hypothetical protein
MAYTISLSISVAATRLTATLNDLTTYGTGGNPARSTVRVFTDGDSMVYDNTVNEALTLTGDTADPETDSSWVFDFVRDGWNRFYFVIIKDAYAGGTTYDIYDAVYDGSNNVYRSKVGSNVGNALSDTAYWEAISDPASLAANKGESNESTNIESTIYQRILIPNGQYGYGNYISSVSGCTDCDQAVVLTTANLLNFQIQAALVADERSELPEGEIIARRLEALLETC